MQRTAKRRAARTMLPLLALALAASAPAGSRRIAFDHLSIDQGLSQSIVEDIVQDRLGFMWFVTEDGLNRYDGFSFVVFRNRAGDPASLSHNEIKAACEDHDGAIWVGSFSAGLNRFDPRTERVTRYQHDPADPGSLAGTTVRAILQDRGGALWVGTQDAGLDRLDPATGRFTHHRSDLDDPGTIGADDVRALLEGYDGTLWIGTNGGGLARRDPASGAIARLRHDPREAASLADDRVFALLEDRAGRLWVGTAVGLDRLDPATGRFVHIPVPATPGVGPAQLLVRDLCQDHQGTIWIAFDGAGLGRLDPESGRPELIRHDPLDPASLSTDRVWSVYQDRSRVLWAGTYGGGLNRFDVARERFRHVRHDPADPGSLGHDIVWCFLKDPDGTLWVGTDSGGLDRLDPRTGRWRHYRHDPRDPASLAHDTVRAVVRDRNGSLWVATNGGGLDRMEADGRFVHHRHDPADPGSLAHDELRSVMQDSAGRLWVSTFGGGLDRLDSSTGRFLHLRHDPTDPASLPSDFVRVVVEDRRGRLWVGTQGGGLARLDPATGRFACYRSDPDDPHSLSNDHVFGIHEDAAGRLWLATFGGGLNCLDPETGVFTRITTADGLASNSLYALLEDDAGSLWISSTRGLTRYDPTTGAMRTFDARDGLQSNEFNGGAAYRAADGELFFGGIEGFNAFYADEIVPNPVVPEIVVTDLFLFNQRIRPGEAVGDSVPLDRPITFADHLALSWRDAVVTLEFAALHFSSPEKNRYAYQLEGFSESWIPVAAGRHDATFTGLSPGRYVFRVRGSNCDGVWNDRPAELAILVAPPFWGTWWFRVGVGLVALGLAVGAVRVRTRGLRMRTELEAAHDAQMAIMPQHDPDVPGYDVSGACLPASEVGGDFYDHFWLDGEPGRFCLVVGDAAGKAMKAAMTAVMSDGMVASIAPAGGDAAKIMTALNRALHGKVGEKMFVAMCLALLDPESGELEVAVAGLCEPLLRSATGTETLSPPGPRLPLGAFPATAYRTSTRTLREGDVVVLFSDGVPEARGPGGEPYGYDAPAHLLASLDTAALSARDIKQALLADLHRFTAGTRPSDDVTVLVLKACRRDPPTA
jgi:ligand-binding sensor domain-containing protein